MIAKVLFPEAAISPLTRKTAMRRGWRQEFALRWGLFRYALGLSVQLDCFLTFPTSRRWGGGGNGPTQWQFLWWLDASVLEACGLVRMDADWQVVLAHNDLSSFCHFNRQPGRNSATETETALKNLTPRYKQKRCVSKSCFREVLTESPPDKKWPRTTQKYGRSDHRLSQKRDEIT